MKLHSLLAPIFDVNQKRSSAGGSYLELDGLRGIAVIIVLMSHTSAFGMHGQGSLGVLLFFFLSGFVLTLPFIDNLKQVRSNASIGRFFANRVLRIIPAYWFSCFVIYLWTSSSIEWLLWNVSFIKGWNHFWSVAEEVRFYILFPFVVLFLSFFKQRIIQVLIVIFMILFFYEYRDVHKIDMMNNGKSVGFYFWMFLGGMLTCLLHRYEYVKIFLHKPVIRWTMQFLGFFVLIIFAACATTPTPIHQAPVADHFPNVLNLKGIPDSTTDRSVFAFSDLGAWHGYALPSEQDKTFTGSFIGPFIMTQDNGVWINDCLSKLEIINVKKDKKINLQEATILASNSFPHKLQQTFQTKNPALNITTELIFVSNRSALIKVAIQNKSKEENLDLAVRWSGKSFLEEEIPLNPFNPVPLFRLMKKVSMLSSR